MGVARTLIETLKSSALMIYWRKKQQTRARVKRAIRDDLRRLGLTDPELPGLIDSVYAHVFDVYADRTHHVYAQA